MKLYDVVGIGNAIVDILANESDAFLEHHDIEKAGMHLIDQDRANEIYHSMPPTTEISGGSCANSIAGLASFGGKAAFIGKVRNDQLGDVFSHDLEALGIKFSTPRATSGPSTAISFIIVTPDAERTMCTYLGVAAAIRESDIDEAIVSKSKILFIEGYLWHDEETKQAIRKAITIAKKNQCKVAFTLCDPGWVDMHREEFQQLIEKDIDIVFANELEVKALYQKENFDDVIPEIKGKCDISVLTRGVKGAVILQGDETYEFDAEQGLNVVDTTGAGDAFASGFLFGLTQGFHIREAGKLGVLAASEVIQHLGARSQNSFKGLVHHVDSSAA